MVMDTLARQIIVRHREAGHLRLQVPAVFGQPAARSWLEQALRALQGIYRVQFEPTATGLILSIHYEALACSESLLVRTLYPALEMALEQGAQVADSPEIAASERDNPLAAPVQQAMMALNQHLLPLLQRFGRWLPGAAPLSPAPSAQKAGEVSAMHSTWLMLESLLPEKLAERLLPLLRQSMSEQAVINFLNDMVAFYLVRVHWDLITRRWLREPLQFRKAWLTVFYLLFLLVRFRRRLQKQAGQLPVAHPGNPAA
jgi:hypothetical protein